MKPHVVPYQADKADAHRHQDPKECGNHGDGHSGQKFEPGVVIVVLRDLEKKFSLGFVALYCIIPVGSLSLLKSFH